VAVVPVVRTRTVRHNQGLAGRDRLDRLLSARPDDGDRAAGARHPDLARHLEEVEAIAGSDGETLPSGAARFIAKAAKLSDIDPADKVLGNCSRRRSSRRWRRLADDPSNRIKENPIYIVWRLSSPCRRLAEMWIHVQRAPPHGGRIRAG